MKIYCDVIRDLLPLYEENMVSKATRDLVLEHIQECEGCRKELEGLKALIVTEEMETGALKRVSAAIRRRRWLAVMTAILLVVTLASGTVMLLDAEVYLSAEEAVEQIWVEGDQVRIRWDNRVIGTGMQTNTDDPGNYGVAAWTNLSKLLFPTEKIPYDALDEEVRAYITRDQYAAMDNTSSYAVEQKNTNFWYYDLSKQTAERILDGGMPGPEAPLMQDGKRIQSYVYVMAILCMMCSAAGLLLEKKRYGQILISAAVVSGSCLVSAVIVTAGNLVDVYGKFTEMLVDSTVVMIPMVLFGLCVLELIKLNRQDKLL